MTLQVGKSLLRRLGVVLLFFLAFVTAVVIVRMKLQMQPISGRLLWALVLLQSPHAAYIAAGVATFWTMDHLLTSGQVTLLSASGVSWSRITRALLWPLLSFSVVMAVSNATLFRKASLDLQSLSAVAEMDSLAGEMTRRQVFRLGGLSLLARGVSVENEQVVIDHSVLSYGTFVLSPDKAVVEATGLRLVAPEITLLRPELVGSAKSGYVQLPESAPLSPAFHARQKPALTLRGVAFGLDALLFGVLAIICARQGAARNRRLWFLVWLFGAVAPTLALENVITRSLLSAPLARCLVIPALPLALTLAFLPVMLLSRAKGRRAT